MLTGIKDLDLKIVSELKNDEDVNIIFQLNKHMYSLSKTESFWMNRFIDKYGKMNKLSQISWKTFYTEATYYYEKYTLDIAMGNSIKNNKEYLVDFFLNMGCEDWDRGLAMAAYIGNRDLVVFFNEKGEHNYYWAFTNASYGNHPELFDIINQNNYTSFSGAALGGHKDLVEFFNEKGANDWGSGMHHAAKGGHKDLVDFFIEKGANNWNSGMYNAAFGGHKDLVDFFIEKGAIDWNSGMFGASKGGHKDLVDFFIEKGANYWNLCMNDAAEGGHLDLIKFFIEKGAKKTRQTIREARRSGNKKVIQFIEDLKF